MHLLIRFDTGETLAFFMVFSFLHSQQRRVQFLHRFEKGETLAILFMLFRLPHSQKRTVQLLFRFGKGKTLAMFSWFSVPV